MDRYDEAEFAPQDGESSEGREGDGRGGNFFHVDRRTWAAICHTQNIAAAASYLVIAQGTWGQSRISRWSAKSVEKYTGLHSTRAKVAIGELLSAGFLKHGEKSTALRPRYEVVPFREFEEIDRPKRIGQLPSYLDLTYELLQKGPINPGRVVRRNASMRGDLAALVQRGLAEEHDDTFYSLAPPEGPPQLIWLPNALVTGANGEHSPVRLVRGRHDLIALRLLVDLYQAQNLSADGGIARTVLLRPTERKEITRRGRFIIWGFELKSAEHYWTPGILAHLKNLPRRKDAESSPSWDALSSLIDLGLIYEVLHLVESTSLESEIIHPYGTTANAEPMEIELGQAAQRAAVHMMAGYAVASASSHLAPIYDALSNVQMVGVFRLRYRPKTLITRDWYRRLKEIHTVFMPSYAKLCGETTLQAKTERAKTAAAS